MRPAKQNGSFEIAMLNFDTASVLLQQENSILALKIFYR